MPYSICAESYAVCPCPSIGSKDQRPINRVNPPAPAEGYGGPETRSTGTAFPIHPPLMGSQPVGEIWSPGCRARALIRLSAFAFDLVDFVRS
jgi:hypothetical protein